ncbi:MAG: HIT family protein [Candidatus Aenigmatarchaeota archaeon]
MECELCALDEKSVIKKYDHWTVCLNYNQYYLGRNMIVLNRHLENYLEISEDEHKELWDIMHKVNHGLTNLFSPDLFNYAVLMNVTRHVHMHMIPRYQTQREFEGQKFLDERWGKNYVPYPRDYKISGELFQKIRAALTKELG